MLYEAVLVFISATLLIYFLLSIFRKSKKNDKFKKTYYDKLIEMFGNELILSKKGENYLYNFLLHNNENFELIMMKNYLENHNLAEYYKCFDYIIDCENSEIEPDKRLVRTLYSNLEHIKCFYEKAIENLKKLIIAKGALRKTMKENYMKYIDLEETNNEEIILKDWFAIIENNDELTKVIKVYKLFSNHYRMSKI